MRQTPGHYLQPLRVPHHLLCIPAP